MLGRVSDDRKERNSVDVEELLDGFDGLAVAELADRLDETCVEDHSVETAIRLDSSVHCVLSTHTMEFRASNGVKQKGGRKMRRTALSASLPTSACSNDSLPWCCLAKSASAGG